MTGPSLRFTTVRLSGDFRNTQTEYICGRNARSEGCSCTGRSETASPSNIRYEYGPLRAHIRNRDLNYHFELEPVNRIYTATRTDQYGGPAWAKPRLLQPAKPSGKTIHHHHETIATGERREIFGSTARRVITKSHQTTDSQLTSESETDGWYIDAPAAWLRLHPPPKPGTFAYLASGTGERDDHQFSVKGERETGFVVLMTSRHKYFFPDEAGNLMVRETTDHVEITEFSENALGPDLFVPPPDFKRVARLQDGFPYSLAYRLRFRWEMLKDSLSLPDKIEKFTTQLAVDKDDSASSGS